MTSTEFTVGATDRANKVLAFDASGEISIAQELGTFKGNSATVTTAAFSVRDIIKATTTAQLNNIYICVADSVIGDSLTDTDHFALLVDAVAAGTSATAAATSATASATSATASASSATTSGNSATASASSATAAANSATAAASSATDAANSADAFDDVYLGTKSSDPTTDNDGDALAAGMLYFNSTNDVLRVYSGSAWQDAAINSTGVVTLAGTQTLTNKTLTSPVISEVVSVSNGNISVLPNGSGKVLLDGNGSSGGISVSDGLIDIRTGTGNVSKVKFYCESSNAHAQTLQAQPHSAGSSAVLTLPTATGTLIGTGDTGTLPLTTIDIDGGTDIGADLTTSDLIVVDDGAGGTNKKAALSRVVTLMSAQGFSTDDPTALAIALG